MSIEQYLTERDQAASIMDLEWARQNGMAGMSDESIRIAMHKMRYELTSIDPELRHESAKWLRDRNYGRMTGGALLPEGELP
jgi:hypothetical protein